MKDTTTIERVIQQIIKTSHPSSGDDLAGFVIDVEHYLENCGLFTSISVNRTNDPACMLDITVTIVDRVATIQNVSQALQNVWMSIGYQHFQATSCELFKEATVLRFITVISDESFFVTGKISAAGGPYGRLVEQFERDFGSVHGPLRSLG